MKVVSCMGKTEVPMVIIKSKDGTMIGKVESWKPVDEKFSGPNIHKMKRKFCYIAKEKYIKPLKEIK